VQPTPSTPSTPSTARVLAFAASRLGPCEVIADHTWAHRASSVLRVRDAAGGEWVAKCHGERERYVAELAAYRSWVPALGDRAPMLRAHDDELQTLVLSALPGELSPWPGDEETHRQAGALLRRLHDSEPAAPWDDFAADKLAEYDELVPAASPLLPTDILECVRAEVLALASLDAVPSRVPCHRDYTPRNWLIDGSRVTVVDFELARRDVWINDLARLESGPWHGDPGLRAAFRDGYGRTPSAAEAGIARACRAVTAVWLVVKGRRYAEADLEAANRQGLQSFMNRRW